VQSDRRCRVIVLGLAQNCASTIEGLFRFVDELRKSGFVVDVLIGENGSSDGTADIIRTASSASFGISLVDTSFLADIPERLRRISVGREHLLKLARGKGYEVVCVADLDEPIERPPSVDKVISAIELLWRRDDVFAVSATSHPYYYDLLAFDDGRSNFIGLDQRIKRLERAPLAYYRLFANEIYPAQKALTTKSEIKCLSAFNGFCLYKAVDYFAATYLSSDAICEHVSLNRKIASQTKKHMLVDPNLIVIMPYEHGPKGTIGFWVQRAVKLARRLNRWLWA